MLERFQHNSHSQAEAAARNANSAMFAPDEDTSGVGQVGFEFLKERGVADQIVEIGHVVVARCEEGEEPALASGGPNFGLGKVFSLMTDDKIHQECEGGESFEFHRRFGSEDVLEFSGMSGAQST